MQKKRISSLESSVVEKRNQIKSDRIGSNLSEKVLGKEHPFTFTSMHNLANVLDGRGKYEEAEQLYRQVLEGFEKVLGKEHPETQKSRDNLVEYLKAKEVYLTSQTDGEAWRLAWL